MQRQDAVSYQLPLCSGCHRSVHDGAQALTSATVMPVLYLHVHVDSFQFALFRVVVLLYSLTFCSEDGEVCGKVHLGEKGTLLLRPEVNKPPISPLWD